MRQLAAVAYGSLCSVVCSSPLASNGRQNHVIAGTVVDRFISWALPLVRDVTVGNGAAELALAGLREFLNIGDASRLEVYVVPIMEACKELLEDERTSLNLLHQLLGILTLISGKFGQCFLPHFIDIVDLLLGWALVPDLSESDRSTIMDSFLQFQEHWLSDLQFSLRLLLKFLGDMEALVQDGSVGTPQQFRRLLALLSCFLTVLEVTAKGMLEMNLLEQISEPLLRMLPRLLACLSAVGKKFGWSKCTKESWRCLILLAGILCEKFSTFYPMAVEILFRSLCEDSSTSDLGSGNIPSFQVHGMLKSNMQLLSLQKLSLLPSSVQKILHSSSPLSQLRLHPNHLVAGSSAATYIFLLQHESDGVVKQAINSLTEELEFLKDMIEKIWGCQNQVDSKCNLDLGSPKCYSDLELFALVKFDLKILLSCVCSHTDGSLLDQMDVATSTSHHERSVMLVSFIFEKLNPFESPIQGDAELQVHVLKTLHKLSKVEFLTKCAITKTNSLDVDSERQNQATSKNMHSVLVIEYLKKYNVYIVRALNALYLTVKLEGLEWVRSFCGAVIAMNTDLSLTHYSSEACKRASISNTLLFSVLEAASDRELKVRSNVASVLELLLQARLIHPGHFYSVTIVVLDKLGDPDTSIKNAFVRLLSIALPITVYAFGDFGDGVGAPCGVGSIGFGNGAYMQWKQVFVLKQQPRQFLSQQLVSVLSYISQRWKVPLSPWIQRLVFSCRYKKDLLSSQQEETGNPGSNGLWMDVKVVGTMLDKVCPVNNVAAAWWAIHEAARHCINVRLRTNLGGPTQTFAALEHMLLDIAHVLQLDTEQNEGNLNLGAARVHLLPMRLMLDFVEALKKNVYNAYEGSSVLPCAARQSSLFFRANKKVCEEWFARICEPMMNAALAMQCHPATVHYCAIRLQDLQSLLASALKDKPHTQVAEYLHNFSARFAGDVMQVLRHMALALCRSREPESLVGLQKWVIVTFSSLFAEDSQLVTAHLGSSLAFSWITGLVYQAHGQYEKAAAHFCHLLQSEDALNSMGSEGVQFAIARVIESYTALSDWKSLETWLLELQALRAKHAGKSYSGALTTAGNEINAIHALARFDEGDLQAAWGFLDLTPKSSSELTLDPKLALQRSEQMLLQAMLQRGVGKMDKVSEEIENAKLMLEETLSVLSLDGLTEAAAYATQLHCIFAFEESCKNNGQDEPKQLSAVVSSLHQVLQYPIIKVHQDSSLWMKVLRVYHTVLPTSLLTLQLFQKLMGLARKQRNFMMAHRLNEFLRTHLADCHEGKYTELFLKNLQYESILLAYTEDKYEDALTSLWSLVHSYMTSPLLTASDADSILKAKACLKLSAWLSQKNLYNNLENVLYKMHADFADFWTLDSTSLSRSRISAPDLNYNLILEEIVGTTTKLSTHFCPVMGKSWLSYASWCYNQARGSVSAPNTILHPMSPVLHPEILPDRFQLKAEEVSRVEAIIIKLFQSRIHIKSASDVGEERIIWPGSDEYLKNEASLKGLVQQTVYLIQEAAAVPGVEDCNGECPSAVLTSQLRMSFLHSNLGIENDDIESSVNELVDIWWSLRRRQVSLFGHAAHGYLQFLTHASFKLQDSHSTSSDLDSVNQKTGNCTLRATLYILHILLNYGVELRDILEHGLATTPLLPWQVGMGCICHSTGISSVVTYASVIDHSISHGTYL